MTNRSKPPVTISANCTPTRLPRPVPFREVLSVASYCVDISAVHLLNDTQFGAHLDTATKDTLERRADVAQICNLPRLFRASAN
jgi:hypothetical protein